jgi:thioester reductase-like protein
MLLRNNWAFLLSSTTRSRGPLRFLYHDLTPFQIRSSVTIIIHNAWRLDFNLGLSSFEPNIRATRRLLDLALTSAHASVTRVLLTSSIGVTRAWPREYGPYPEAPVDDARWCVGGGYGEAKYVSERLLVAAAERGLQTTSFRVGQIAGGDANGAWASTDWVPIMLKSGVALGCLPDAAGVSMLGCAALVTWLIARVDCVVDAS